MKFKRCKPENQILKNNSIKLPTLEESFVVHKSILEVFNKKLSKLKIT